MLRWLAACLVIAGIVHLGTVLALSHDTDASAYATVRRLTAGETLRTVAGPAAGARVLPFADPAAATAFCLFDLDAGPVDVLLPATPSDVVVLSVHDAEGQVVYALTNEAAVGGNLALSIMTPAAMAALDDADDGRLRVAFAGRVGFVAAQAIAAMPSLRPTAAAAAQGLACRRGPAAG